MNADREEKRDHLEHYVNVLQGHARLVSILTREALISRGSTAGTVILSKRSPSLGEGLPTKDVCIFFASAGNAAERGRNAEVLRLLSPDFAGRKTALRMTMW